MTVKKTPNSFCETLINNYSFFFRSNQRASVIIILYICYESLRKVLPAATYSLNLSRSSLRDYSPDEGKKMDILILGFYALSLHLPVAKYRKGLFCRDLRSNNCCRTEACDYCTTREGRGVKRFLSLFLVMYICLKGKCISACEPQDFVTSFRRNSKIQIPTTKQIRNTNIKIQNTNQQSAVRIMEGMETGSRLSAGWSEGTRPH